LAEEGGGDPGAVELDAGRILLAGALLIYLERTLAGREPLPAGEAPRGYGLAPAFLLDPRTVLSCVGPGEAIWLGFEARIPSRATRSAARAGRRDVPSPPAICTALPTTTWRAGASRPASSRSRRES